MQNVELVPPIRRPLIVGIGGYSSGVGKTTLLCDLLRAFPGWEAIKTTRGHYRSCGKDPLACCVSDFLEDNAVVRSGRELTYTAGKDTGLYWDAGAANVHWVIATDAQVGAGIREALSRVNSEAVFVEGNSFVQTVVPDFFIMVVRPDKTSIKTTARKCLGLVSAVYVSGDNSQRNGSNLSKCFAKPGDLDSATPIFSNRNFSALAKAIDQELQVARQTTLHRVAS